MFRKTLLLGAALTVAAVATVQAQTPVYSVNVVGYHKVVIPTGFSMIANQVTGTNNTIGYFFPTPTNGTRFYKFTGTSFSVSEYFGPPNNVWDDGGVATLGVGEGGFIYNPGAPYTNTFAGEVLVGSITNTIPAGFSIKSCVLPQGGSITAALQYTPSNGDRVYKFNGVSYDISEYFGTPFNVWDSEPVLNVGESFFFFKQSSGQWVRVFSVN
ncbi:MAG: hypothetical protein HY301_19710 [Verrucomicrobia bacterium]|nr:hypothetical protein [Verrucomicrobiota bacterium]